MRGAFNYADARMLQFHFQWENEPGGVPIRIKHLLHSPYLTLTRVISLIFIYIRRLQCAWMTFEVSPGSQESSTDASREMSWPTGKSASLAEYVTLCQKKGVSSVTLNFHPQGRNVNDVTNEGKS